MTRNRKNEPFWFDGGPFPIKLAYCANRKAWKLAMKQLGTQSEPFPSETAGRCTTFDGTKFPERVFVIVINSGKVSDVQVIGLIAHEAVHVAQYAARKMYPYDDRARLDDETEAYMVQWLTQNIYNAYKGG